MSAGATIVRSQDNASSKKLSRRDLEDLIVAARDATVLLGQVVLSLNDFRAPLGMPKAAHGEVFFSLTEDADRALFAARAYACDQARALEETFHLSSGAIE